MIKKLLIALLFITSFSSIAQEETFHQEVLRYLNINGTADQYTNATSGLFDLLKQQYSSKNVPSDVWTELEGEKPQAVNRVLNMLVSAYRGSYGKEDIQNMLAFFETSTGKQLLLDKTSLNADQQKEAATFYNSATGQKILESEQEIGKNISEISEIWSRDLYRSMVDKLAEKGYTR